MIAASYDQFRVVRNSGSQPGFIMLIRYRQNCSLCCVGMHVWRFSLSTEANKGFRFLARASSIGTEKSNYDNRCLSLVTDICPRANCRVCRAVHVLPYCEEPGNDAHLDWDGLTTIQRSQRFEMWTGNALSLSGSEKYL